ncbi:UNVERIFIED_CONTAM: hypothetical protein Slati_3952000 [Sesamum latifolium]|uniref:Uncharacterized protein n=1 Tax=Sesamum latifolium TaxID=2727402 RepID=A0AAW2TRY4_9LAMI
MDHFPSVNKAYSMVLRVERQRLVNVQTSDGSEGVALHTNWNENKGGTGFKGGLQTGYKGKGLVDKRSQTCVHRGRLGHTKETCFKLHGVPDWYKNLKDQKRREGGQHRGFSITSGDSNKTGEQVGDFGEAVKQVSKTHYSNTLAFLEDGPGVAPDTGEVGRFPLDLLEAGVPLGDLEGGVLVAPPPPEVASGINLSEHDIRCQE